MLSTNISGNDLVLDFTGVAALLARRRHLYIPRRRIHRAFVLRKSFAVNACPRVPCPGWTSHRSRIGIFGFRDSAQLWCTGSGATVLALYLRGEPYHRIVYEVPHPAEEAAIINRWLDDAP